MKAMMARELMVDGRKGGAAFTVMDVFVLVVGMAVLSVLLMVAFHRPRRMPNRASCTNNLRQIGLAFRDWSTDHNDLYPMQFYTNKDGSMKFTDPSTFFRYYNEMSNELNNLRLLVCPADKTRTIATNWANLTGTNISYGVGLDGNPMFPASLLSTDRNITNGTALRNGVLWLATNHPAGWTKERHDGDGNVLLSDGSVQQVTTEGLRLLVVRSGRDTNRLAMP